MEGIILVIVLLVWALTAHDDSDDYFGAVAARDKARHDARRRSAAAYRANREAQYRAKLQAQREASRRALVDEHNAKVPAARRNPNSSYADRSYWSY